MHSRLGKLLRSRTKTPGHALADRRPRLPQPVALLVRLGDDNLWIGDVGQDTLGGGRLPPARQLDKLANFGWSRYEGYSVYDRGHRLSRAGQKVRPVVVYSHAHGCSISGGYVYRGTAVRAARGRYFYGDYCAGTIWSFRVGKHGRASRPVVSGHVPSLSSFGVDGNNELYAISLDGALYELR